MAKQVCTICAEIPSGCW